MKKAYKIFEERNNKLYNLFFALGTRKEITFDQIIQAKRRWVSESSAKTKYWSGFHCVESLDTMSAYLSRFSAERLPRLVVLEVSVDGLRRKPTKGSLAMLADAIMVSSKARRWRALDLVKKVEIAA